MFGQLFVALIESIHGIEEGHGISNVNHHGRSELPRGAPQGSQTPVIDRHQYTVLVPDVQVEGLVYLEPVCAQAVDQ